MRSLNMKSGFWLLTLVLSAPPLIRAADQKPEELVARHLDSLGTAEARAANKSRVIQGPATFKMPVGGGSQLEGKGAVVSEERKLNIMMKFASDYRGEQFISDGDKWSIAATTADHRRTAFGEFVKSQPLLLQEGLLGGALSTAWALANIEHNHPHLSSAGLKKVDGRQLLDLHYESKRGNDMDIHLYFDPETYRHVLTVYSLTAASGFGGSVLQRKRSSRPDHAVEQSRKRSHAKLQAARDPLYPGRALQRFHYYGRAHPALPLQHPFH